MKTKISPIFRTRNWKYFFKCGWYAKRSGPAWSFPIYGYDSYVTMFDIGAITIGISILKRNNDI